MASDEQFSLCWNNFHANMSAGFHGLLSRGDLVDVTLAAEGRLLQAHKLVLSVCSPYFQEMFKMNPTQHPIVFLKDVSHSALRDLLQFMYQGEVNVKQEELASFISTAEQLQVKGLTGNQNEESSTPSKPKPTSRPGPRSSQQRQSVMTKLETDLDSKPSSTPVAIKRPNRPSIASNNSSSSQSGPVKRKCVDPLEAGPSGSAKEEFVTIPDEDENNAVAPKMEPEFVNESMWDDDDDGTNNDETNFGEDDSNMEMTGFDGSTTGDGNLTGGGEGGAVGDAQDRSNCKKISACSSVPLPKSNGKDKIVGISVSEDSEKTLLLAVLANQTKMMKQLSKLQSSFNHFRDTRPRDLVNSDDTTPQSASNLSSSRRIKPAKNLQDLEELEENLSNEEFFSDVVSEMKLICGFSGTSIGLNSCYKLVDYFVERECLLHCSWTGSTRSETEGLKIPFKRFTNLMKCFHALVQESDSTFSEVDCQEFFKRILRNSKKRLSCTGQRASTRRQRLKQSDWSLKKELIQSIAGNDHEGETDIMVFLEAQNITEKDTDNENE
ncbi:uncharacterized protein isoform X1 [Choristoneura fumiferana]|uniref:uncharacterized protein isoform X1 n=1 Tax=Choristoneura fumiferana TaxID=7141 RepID=UPI003D15B6DB